MKSHLKGVAVFLVAFCGLSAQAINAPPLRSVLLHCPPLPYSFSCSIPTTAFPEHGTHCWYRANGQSYLMRSNRRFGFTNDIVSLQLRDTAPISGVVRELSSGRSANCQVRRSDIFEAEPSSLSPDAQEFEFFANENEDEVEATQAN